MAMAVEEIKKMLTVKRLLAMKLKIEKKLRNAEGGVSRAQIRVDCKHYPHTESGSYERKFDKNLLALANIKYRKISDLLDIICALNLNSIYTNFTKAAKVRFKYIDYTIKSYSFKNIVAQRGNLKKVRDCVDCDFSKAEIDNINIILDLIPAMIVEKRYGTNIDNWKYEASKLIVELDL